VIRRKAAHVCFRDQVCSRMITVPPVESPGLPLSASAGRERQNARGGSTDTEESAFFCTSIPPEEGVFSGQFVNGKEPRQRVGMAPSGSILSLQFRSLLCDLHCDARFGTLPAMLYPDHGWFWEERILHEKLIYFRIPKTLLAVGRTQRRCGWEAWLPSHGVFAEGLPVAEVRK
jgi:hypothetical protein